MDASRWRRAGTCLLVGFATMATAQTSAAWTYERWQPPALAADQQERDLYKALRQVAAPMGTALARDGRLAAVAHELLPWARCHAGEPLAMAALRQRAWRHGLTDGELGVLAVRAPADSLLEQVAAQWRQTLEDGADLNRLAVALTGSEDDGQATCVLAFSRRLLSLAPIVSQGRPGQPIWLQGRSLAANVERVRLAEEDPDGRVQSVEVPLLLGHFRVALAPRGGPRPLQVQLLVERGRGPEVAAEFALGEAPLLPAASPAPSHRPAGPQQSLLTLIYGLRAAHGLSLPTPSVRLTQLAKAHADDMVAHHFFAHLSPAHGSAAQRLQAAGVPFARVVENLAATSDAEQAFVDWQHSPSHLQNLLDPTVDELGLATAQARLTAEPVFVLLMTRSQASAGHRTTP